MRPYRPARSILWADAGEWKAVEERLNIKAVSGGEINEMLLRAGYRNIRLHIRHNEGRLCAIAEKE